MSIFILFLMIILNWNVRGASCKVFARALKELIRINKPDIIAIQEPRVSGDRAKSVIRNLGFHHHIISDARDFSGGIWILWNNSDISINPLHSHDQFLHVEIVNDDICFWLFTVIYVSHRASERIELWNSILNLANNISLDWMLVGDFNEIVCDSEKKRRGFCGLWEM